MPVLGIGVDIVHLPRFVSLISRRGSSLLAKRILSSGELEGFKDAANCARYLAVRFSVKESAYKALYPVAKPTWKNFTFQSHSERAKPTLIYHPSGTSTNVPRWNFHASVSHDGDYIMTTVLVEENSARS